MLRRYCEHLFRCLIHGCLKYYTVLLETSSFRFFTASVAVSVFRSSSLMISLYGCNRLNDRSFTINFPHCNSSLGFLKKYTSKAYLQSSSSLFLLLKHFAYFCKFFDQLIQLVFVQVGHALSSSLKVVSATFLLVCFLSLSKSTCQTRKNAFYFTSKALFVLEKIKF